MKLERIDCLGNVIDSREISFDHYKEIRDENIMADSGDYNTRIFHASDTPGEAIRIHLSNDDVFDLAEEAYEAQQEDMCCFSWDNYTEDDITHPDEIECESI